MSLKSYAMTIALALCTLLLTAQDSHAFRNLTEGEAVPGFTLKDSSGAAHTLSGYKGKVVVVTFFKTDQENSIKALEDLQKVQDSLGAKGVQVLGLTPDKNDGASIKAIGEQHKITYPMLEDIDRGVYGAWGVFLFPSTAVLDKEGKLFKSVSSYNRKYEETVAGYVRMALGDITAEDLDKELNPEDKEKLTPEQKKAERHMMLGERMVDRKLLDKAAEEYASAVESDPELAAARVKYGFVLLKLEKPAEALEQFTRAIEKDPKAEDAGAGLGAAQVATGELDKGIETLEGALKLNPKPARAHYELGKAYEKKGALDKAAEHYRKAIENIGGALW